MFFKPTAQNPSLSTAASLVSVIEKKVTSVIRSDIETGLLLARSLEKMAKTPDEIWQAQELVALSEVNLSIHKMFH